MTPTTTTGVDLANLLLGLAWLGELDRRQIQRLWFAGKSESTVEKTLARLHREELLAKRAWSIHDEQRGVTAPQLARWSLAPAGHALVKSSHQYPAKPVQVRQQRLIAHDARTTEAIARLVEIGHLSGLSGIYVSHELRLHPHERRPVCDALVVLQFGAFDRPNLVPWSGDPAIADEGRLRFAIEADNDTEPPAVIAAKAVAYRRLDENPEWRAWWLRTYGPLPIPLWVAPSEARAAAIHAQWTRSWPRGCWLITDDAGLQAGRLVYRREGDERRITLSFDHYRKELPPASPLPALPPPSEPPAPEPSTRSEPSSRTADEEAQRAPPPAPSQPAPALPTPAPPLTPARVPPATAPTDDDYRLYPRRPAWWVDWQQLAWGALLWCVVALSLALLLLWDGLRAIVRWYGELDDQAAAVVSRLALGFALIAVASAVWLARPDWLLAPVRSTLTSVEEAVGGLTQLAPPAPPAPALVPPTPSEPACPAAQVAANRLNLRAEPGLRAAVVRKLRRGEILTVLDCAGVEQDGYRWWHVAGGDGAVGWAAATWLEAVRAMVVLPRGGSLEQITLRP